MKGLRPAGRPAVRGIVLLELLFLPHFAPSLSVRGLLATWRGVQGQQKKSEICLKEESEPADSVDKGGG